MYALGLWVGYWCFSSFSKKISAFSLLPYELGRKVQTDIMYWKDEPMSLVFALSLIGAIVSFKLILNYKNRINYE